ncbi:hypothetical protein HOO68_06255 [Candidatus Gracilibacteria bacterium]|nr:hypothetical protein [Candidatus Gracilibacteria bacterium]
MEVANLASIIKETWDTNKDAMDREVLAGDGLSGALIRVLSTNEKIREIVLEGKTNSVNREVINRLIGRIRISLGLTKSGGVNKLLIKLGASEDVIYNWGKINRNGHGFTSGKKDIEFTGKDYASNYRGGNSRFNVKA